MSSFVLDVSELRRREARSRRVRVSGSVTWGVELSRVLPDPPLVADLVLEPIGGGILVRGVVTCAAEHVCHRCLLEFHEDERIEVTVLFERDPDEDGYPIEGDVVDLEQALRDEVLLAFPLLPRCGEACPGVEMAPGTGLNTAPLDDETGASPFAVLRELLQHGDR